MGDLIKVNFRENNKRQSNIDKVDFRKKNTIQLTLKKINEYKSKNIESFIKIFGKDDGNFQNKIVTDVDIELLIGSLVYYNRISILKELYELLQSAITAYEFKDMMTSCVDVKEFKKRNTVDDFIRKIKVLCDTYTQPLNDDFFRK